MKATDLSDEIWNAIADLVGRSQGQRELYFVRITKVDKSKLLIWTEDFGDLAIPLVAFKTSFSHFDTQPTGANVVAGVPLPTKLFKRSDSTGQNPVYQTQIVPPQVGEVAVVLDPWAAKRFPICIGIIQSKTGFWEGEA